MITWALVSLAIMSLCGVNVSAQSSPMAAPAMAPGPATPDCMTLVYNMSDCLTYVEKGSNATKPDKPCCPELAGLLDSNPICLCQLLGKSKDLPVELDINRALQLPSVCGLKTPPVSMCSMVGIPVGAPAGAPTASEIGPSSAAGMSPTEAGVPTSGKNGASSAYISLPYLVAGLAIALALLTL